jgi:hypothetical protein
MSEKIVDKCPSCGSSGTLFIGKGGYLTCSLIDCPQPGVGRALVALLAENEETQEWEKFHPRAVKLLRKRKNFLVIAEDEPYFIEAYKLIREHEKEIGRWTERDEDIYQSANEAKNSW